MVKPVRKRLVLLVVVAVVLVFWMTEDSRKFAAIKLPDSATQQQSAMAAPTSSHAAVKSLPAEFSSLVTGLENLPQSLRDTEVDGELKVDGQGHLVIDISVRQLFDYFLSAMGEESLERIEARLRRYIAFQLEEPAAGEANQLLSDYLALKSALAIASQSFSVSYGQTSSAELRLTQLNLHQLRRSHLTPAVADAFYAEEEAYDRHVLAVMTGETAPHGELFVETLPAEVEASLIAANRIEHLRQQTAQLKQRQGGADELYQLRLNLVGPEAAERLVALDNRRAEWERRVHYWLEQRQSILANKALATDQVELQLQRLRAELFNDSEQRRVLALELGFLPL